MNKTPIEIALDIDETGHITAKKLYELFDLDASQHSRWIKTNLTVPTGKPVGF